MAQELEYSNLPLRVLELAEARGGQWARLVANYRAAKSGAHRHKIGDALMQNASGAMWLAYYQGLAGQKGGRVISEEKAAAARANGAKSNGRPKKPFSQLSKRQQARRLKVEKNE